MSRTGLEEKEPVTVAFSNPMLPDHTLPAVAVTANSCIKVTEDDELIGAGNSGDDSVQVFIKLVFDLIWVSRGGSICADNGHKFLSIGEGESHHHGAKIHTFWGDSKLVNERCFHSKADSGFLSLFRLMTVL